AARATSSGVSAGWRIVPALMGLQVAGGRQARSSDVPANRRLPWAAAVKSAPHRRRGRYRPAPPPLDGARSNARRGSAELIPQRLVFCCSDHYGFARIHAFEEDAVDGVEEDVALSDFIDELRSFRVGEAFEEGPVDRIGYQFGVIEQAAGSRQFAHDVEPQAHGVLGGDELDEARSCFELGRVLGGVGGDAVHEERAEVGLHTVVEGRQLGYAPLELGTVRHLADGERAVDDHGDARLGDEAVAVAAGAWYEVSDAYLIVEFPAGEGGQGLLADLVAIQHFAVRRERGGAELVHQHGAHQVMVLAAETVTDLAVTQCVGD